MSIEKTETYQERMRRKLTVALTPLLLEIEDDSARHAGHSGHDARGETHFNLRVVSKAFEGMPALARHRLVYATVADELKERVHALVIKAIAESEYNYR